MYSCYECESTRDKIGDMNQGCWVLDGVESSEPTCHGCYVTRTEESVLAGMMHDIHRQCLTYPKDAELLEMGATTGCGGLPEGETGEQCWSLCFENDCNSVIIQTLAFSLMSLCLFLA